MPLLLLLLGGGALWFLSQRKRSEPSSLLLPAAPAAPQPAGVLPGEYMPSSVPAQPAGYVPQPAIKPKPGEKWDLTMTLSPPVRGPVASDISAAFRAGHEAAGNRVVTVQWGGGPDGLVDTIYATVEYGASPRLIYPGKLVLGGHTLYLQAKLNPYSTTLVQGWFTPDPWRVLYAVNAGTGKVYGRIGPRRMSRYQAEVDTADLIESGMRHGISTRVVRYDYEGGAWRRA